jgi:hypothetical protein
MGIVSPSLLERFLGRFVARFKQKPTKEVSVVEATPDLDAMRALDGARFYDPGFVAEWIRTYRRGHERTPQISEVQRLFKLSKTTAWRRIKSV